MRHWFDGSPVPAPKILCSAIFSQASVGGKDSAGELSDLYYLVKRAEFVRFDLEESHNGLESTENRRSAGWHGNQHVRLRRPQVSSSTKLHSELRWIAGMVRPAEGVDHTRIHL